MTWCHEREPRGGISMEAWEVKIFGAPSNDVEIEMDQVANLANEEYPNLSPVAR